MAGRAVEAYGTKHEISGNYIYNIRRGIVVASDYTKVSFNEINYVFGDGFRVINNHTIVEYNRVRNSMVIINFKMLNINN